MAEALYDLANANKIDNDIEAAFKLHQKALDIRERTLGPDHRDTARSLYELSKLASYCGDLQRADQLLSRALSIWVIRVGRENLDYSQMLDTLAFIRLRQGSIDEAIKYREWSASVIERVCGPNSCELSENLYWFARILENNERYEEASDVLGRLMKVASEYIKEPAMETADYLNCYARVLKQLGQNECAQKYLRQAKQITDFYKKIR